MAEAGFCASCGQPLDLHDRHIRARVPDALLDIPDDEWRSLAWGSPEWDMLEVPGIGSFVRALLPVRLSGGFSITFGIWLDVGPSVLRLAYDAWDNTDHVGFRMDGRIANSIPPWERRVVGKPALAEGRKLDQLPVVVESPDPLVTQIITEEWPHEQILDAQS